MTKELKQLEDIFSQNQLNVLFMAEQKKLQKYRDTEIQNKLANKCRQL